MLSHSPALLQNSIDPVQLKRHQTSSPSFPPSTLQPAFWSQLCTGEWYGDWLVSRVGTAPGFILVVAWARVASSLGTTPLTLHGFAFTL